MLLILLRLLDSWRHSLKSLDPGTLTCDDVFFRSRHDDVTVVCSSTAQVTESVSIARLTCVALVIDKLPMPVARCSLISVAWRVFHPIRSTFLFSYEYLIAPLFIVNQAWLLGSCFKVIYCDLLCQSWMLEPCAYAFQADTSCVRQVGRAPEFSISCKVATQIPCETRELLVLARA